MRTFSAMRGSGVRSSRMPPVSRSRPTDQLAITSAPMNPASGSIQSQPNARAMRSPVIVLFEFQFMVVVLAALHEAKFGKEGMRLRNLVARFQISAAVFEREQLATAIRPDGLDGHIGGRQ